MRSFIALIALFSGSAALAHLIPADTGTLRLVDDKAYVVMGVPSSALFEEDRLVDGAISEEAYGSLHSEVQSLVRAGIGLDCGGSPLALLDLRMQPEVHYQNDSGWVAQVTAMLIFAMPDNACRLRFETALYGPSEAAVTYKMRVTAADESVRYFELTSFSSSFEIDK